MKGMWLICFASILLSSCGTSKEESGAFVNFPELVVPGVSTVSKPVIKPEWAMVDGVKKLAMTEEEGKALLQYIYKLESGLFKCQVKHRESVKRCNLVINTCNQVGAPHDR